MQEEKNEKKGRKKRHILLRIDSFIDSGLWTAAARLVDFWEDVTIASRKLHVRGWKKLLVNLTCDALTFGTAGSVVLLALAMPAFEETKKDWRYRGDFAVTFLDR